MVKLCMLWNPHQKYKSAARPSDFSMVVSVISLLMQICFFSESRIAAYFQTLDLDVHEVAASWGWFFSGHFASWWRNSCRGISNVATFSCGGIFGPNIWQTWWQLRFWLANMVMISILLVMFFGNHTLGVRPFVGTCLRGMVTRSCQVGSNCLGEWRRPSWVFECDHDFSEYAGVANSSTPSGCRANLEEGSS